MFFGKPTTVLSNERVRFPWGKSTIMNPLDDRTTCGTIGELLVQLRLFLYGVQASPPLKDSGNDLIAVRGEVFRAIQVKTTRWCPRVRLYPIDRQYHLLALVVLSDAEGFPSVSLDRTKIFLIPKSAACESTRSLEELGQFELSQEAIDRAFAQPREAA